MALIRSINRPDSDLILDGDRVYLRPPQPEDFPGWARLRASSRDFLTPWEPIWPQDDLTRTAFRRRLMRYGRDLREGAAYPLFVFEAASDQILGGVTLSNLQRGVTQSAAMGYWMGEPFAGKGLMSDAVRTAIRFAFRDLRLHRLEAACLPHNDASRRVLEKCGFQKEGVARQYLKINGQWQDHLLFAIVRGDPASTVRV